ncbi:MAG: hypothetical protein AB1768_21240 [Pseudomonadota bacterium]
MYLLDSVGLALAGTGAAAAAGADAKNAHPRVENDLFSSTAAGGMGA